MPTTILQTKLFIPPPNPDHLPRRGLLDRLNSGLKANLTLVTAPPGFGKTSLISAWVRDAHLPAGWLSLDKRDNDPAQFFSHFIAALQLLQPSLGAQEIGELYAAQSFSIETLLIGLINDIAGLPGRYLLVLDDFHLVENLDIQRGLLFLIEHLPPQLHLVIATRSDPPIPLAKLRAGGKINELRVEDLRFSSSEVSDFLQAAIGNAITPEEIEALEARTEGWIAGLQLAVLSLKANKEQPEFLQGFIGSHRYILDYLVEEVLNQQPAYLRRFLLRTSVLDRFCADLCDAVLSLDPQESALSGGQGSTAPEHPTVQSQEILEHLERSNIFLVPLDKQRRWYRYHHLFADILRHLLHTQHSSLVPSLHQRASAWFAANGLIDEAIEQAFTAKNWRLASQYISRHSRRVFLHGEFYRLVGWVERLPVEYRRQELDLSIYYAWSLLFSGKIEEAEHTIQVETRLTPTEESFLSLNNRLLGAFLAYHRGRPQEALPVISQVKKQLDGGNSSPDEQLLYGFTCVGLADTYRMLSQLDLAERAYQEALPVNQRVGNLLAMLVCYRNLGDILFERAQLQRAAAVYQEGIERSRRWAEKEFGTSYDLLPSANLFMRLGEIHFERNDLEQAASMMGKAVHLLELSGSTHRINVYYMQARIALARYDLFTAHEQMQKLRQAAARITASYPFSHSGRFLTDLRLRIASQPLPPGYPVGAEEMRNEIEDWVHSAETLESAPLPYLYDAQSVVLARAYLFLGQPDKAVALLAPLMEAGRAGRRLRNVLERLVVLARAHLALGDLAPALAAISEALTIGEAPGMVRTFLDEGPGLWPLLQTALQCNTASRLAARILDALSAEGLPGSDPHGNNQGSANRFLIEPLSDRELEVLSLVANGLSNQQIAEKLFIALSTVKKHTNAIFGKLNVGSRMEAVQHARSLGLI